MRSGIPLSISALLLLASGASAQPAQTTPAAAPDNDPIKALVGRLELNRYKATIRGLTKFGDRRQGTDRNRNAIDWIEAQLKSYGCADIGRVRYDYQPPARGGRGANTANADGRGGGGRGAGGRGAGAA